MGTEATTPTIFLGGTVGANNWRIDAIAELTRRGIPRGALYDPTVDVWTEEIQAREDAVKRDATYQLYVIAHPGGTSDAVSTYSLVEAVMGLYDAPARTIVSIDTSVMSGHAKVALRKVLKNLRARFPSAPIFDEPHAAVDWLASHYLAAR